MSDDTPRGDERFVDASKAFGDVVTHKIVAARFRPCSGGDNSHACALQTEGGSEIAEDEAVLLLDAGAHLWMDPPPELSLVVRRLGKSDARLLIQVRECPLCHQRVLFS